MSSRTVAKILLAVIFVLLGATVYLIFSETITDTSVSQFTNVCTSGVPGSGCGGSGVGSPCSVAGEGSGTCVVALQITDSNVQCRCNISTPSTGGSNGGGSNNSGGGDPQPAQICTPGAWATGNNCGINGCGSIESARCNSAGTAWDCISNPGLCASSSGSGGSGSNSSGSGGGSNSGSNNNNTGGNTQTPSASGTGSQPPAAENPTTTNPTTNLPDTAIFFSGDEKIFGGLLLIIFGAWAVKTRGGRLKRLYSDLIE